MSTIRGAKKRFTHELILLTARDLFQSQGYVATTIEDIATAAGTTRATLYLHFSSKAELLERLVLDVDELFTFADDPPLEQVVRSGDRTLIREWLDRKLEQWAQIRPSLEMVRQSDSDPGVASIVGGWNDRAIAKMTSGLDAAGRFDPASRLIRCTIAFGSLESLSRRYAHAGGWEGLGRRPALEALAMVWCDLLADPRR